MKAYTSPHILQKIAFLLFFSLSVHTLLAQCPGAPTNASCTFTALGGDWNNPASWSRNPGTCTVTVPSSTSCVTIPNGITITTTNGANISARSITVNTGGSLTLNSTTNTTVATTVTINGAFTAGTGTFSAASLTVATNNAVSFTGTTTTITKNRYLFSSHRNSRKCFLSPIGYYKISRNENIHKKEAFFKDSFLLRY